MTSNKQFECVLILSNKIEYFLTRPGSDLFTLLLKDGTIVHHLSENAEALRKLLLQNDITEPVPIL